MTREMEEVGARIRAHLKMNNPEVDVEEFNSMVLIVYYDKRDRGREEQLAMHRDQRWSSKGKFNETLNSQKQNTATCVLTLGDTRELLMQCYKDSNDGRGSLKVEGPCSTEVFSQTHGSVFELDPVDEETKLRTQLNSSDLTYFKHGGVKFGRGLSIGLAFRRTTNTRLVDIETGRLVLAPESRELFVSNDDHLRQYLKNDYRKQHDERKLKSLYLKVKAQYLS